MANNLINNPSMACSDYVEAISEEIALEGLDGITVESLWKRLDDRPNFTLRPSCDAAKQFIWKIIVRLRNVEFYCLPSPRPTIQLFDRYKELDELGHYTEPEVASANAIIYPHNPIDKNGVRGSCSTFDERVDISEEIRAVDLDAVVKRWGNKLAIVADQATRFAALKSSDCDPEVELQISQYCILERIGRSRFQGEVTQGKFGLQIFGLDSRSLFYVCKILVSNGFVTKKHFPCRIGKQLTSGRVIHLTKFSIGIKTKRKTMVESVMEYLKENPVSLYRTIQTKFASHHQELKKIIVKYSKHMKSEVVPYREFYPDAKPNEWKTKSGAEKQVRLVKLLDPDWKNSDDEEDDEEEESGAFIEVRNQRLDISVIRHCYQIVEQSGKKGMSQNDIQMKLGVTGLHARSLTKFGVSRGLFTSTFVDVGRQRKRVFHSKLQKGDAVDQLEEERDKLLKNYSHELAVVESVPQTKKRKLAVEIKNEEEDENVPNASRSLVSVCVDEGSKIETKITTVSYKNDRLSSLYTEVSSNMDSSSLTARTLKRVNLILQTVQTHRVIYDYFKLLRLMNEEEAAEGSVYLIDRKTVQKLLQKLEMDGLIKLIHVTVKGHGKEKNFKFICHPSVNEDHSEIQSAVEQAKMKLPISNKATAFKPVDPGVSPSLPPIDPKAGRKYGLKPKFVRMQILHTYMYYLMRRYEGRVLEKSEMVKVLNGLSTDENLLCDLPQVYADGQNWKMFIPPLPQHSDCPEGWALMSDLIVRLPLILFVSLVNVTYDIPKLTDYLQHPIKKYYLIKHLPSEISNVLTINRRFIFAISECVTKLCFLGLIQMGPQRLKEKDQILVYVNKHALLLDTTVSASGYNHVSEDTMYEQTNYVFKTVDDVEQYWFDLWNYAMNTNLGCRNVMTGKPVVVESVTTKNVLLESTMPRAIGEAESRDIGYLPGDRLGAAGLDSDLFVHLKRNWYWNKNDENCPAPKAGLADPCSFNQSTKRRSLGKKSGLTKKAGRTANSDASSSASQPASSSKGSNKMTKETSATVKSSESLFKSKAKHKKVTRIVKPKTMKGGRKPYYDQIDREALGKMDKLRVGWSQAEDNLLLLCKVASLYMSTNARRYVAKNFFAVREILHTNCPELSKNKTSRACQRRILYMMKNPSTAHSVYLCLEEIKQDPEITDQFSSAVSTLDAKLKAQGEGPKGFQGEYDKIFKSLVCVLLKKLKMVTHSDNATLDNMTIPDTLEEFMNRYKVVMPKCLNYRYGQFNEVQNIVDIMCSVVNCIIHSSLCCVGDKTAYSYQLFYVYQQYPDKLLRSVMAKCRSMQLVSCRKRYQKWKVANSSCLPLSSCPYQLSITYTNILQARYQYQIFSENFGCLSTFLEVMEQSNIFQVNNGGECAAVVELYSSKLAQISVEIPESTITLDPRLSDTEESYTLIMKRFREILANFKASKKDATVNSDDEQEEEEESVPEKVDELHLNKTVLATMASRVALYMLRDDGSEQLDKSLQHAHDYFVLKPCKVFLKVNKEEYCMRCSAFEEKKNKVITEINRSTHFPQNHVDNKNIVEDMKEFPDICVSGLLQLIESKKELGATYKDILNSHPERLHEQWHDVLVELCNRQYILRTGSVDTRFVHNRHSKPWLVRSYFMSRERREGLRGTVTVNSSHVFKLTDESGPEPAKKRKLETGEEVTCEDRREHSVNVDVSGGGGSHGADVVVLKPRKHDRKRKWVTLPKENKFEEMDLSNMEPVQISIRPWVKIDGTLNRRVLDRLLGSVLGLILSSPGSSLKRIQERLTPALQPYHTLELVEILGKLACVHVQSIVKSGRPSILSKKSFISLKPAVGHEDPNLLIVHPALQAITILGQFIGNKNYTKDYLDVVH